MRTPCMPMPVRWCALIVLHICGMMYISICTVCEIVYNILVRVAHYLFNVRCTTHLAYLFVHPSVLKGHIENVNEKLGRLHCWEADTKTT